ncbi:MAG: hypothetical protein ACJA2D_002642 [Pseudohongiellaceae bacterium]|jgi:hypothetical protein
MKPNLILITSIATGLVLSGLSHAESLVDGIYLSGGDDNGKGKCTLSLKSTNSANKYGDETFELESSGDGSCEWSALGISKSYAITAGMVTNAGAPAFVKISFPFGPAGNNIEVTTIDLDGTLRNSDSFVKQQANLTGGD